MIRKVYYKPRQKKPLQLNAHSVRAAFHADQVAVPVKKGLAPLKTILLIGAQTLDGWLEENESDSSKTILPQPPSLGSIFLEEITPQKINAAGNITLVRMTGELESAADTFLAPPINMSSKFSLKKSSFKQLPKSDKSFKSPPKTEVKAAGSLTQAASELAPLDRKFLITALHELRKLGIPIDPDFEVILINKLRRYGGENFLHSHHKADLIVSCIIVDSQLLATEARNNNQNIWYEKAQESGAKAVFVVNGEIKAKDFQGPDFTTAWTDQGALMFQDFTLLVSKKYLATGASPIALLPLSLPTLQPGD